MAVSQQRDPRFGLQGIQGDINIFVRVSQFPAYFMPEKKTPTQGPADGESPRAGIQLGVCLKTMCRGTR